MIYSIEYTLWGHWYIKSWFYKLVSNSIEYSRLFNGFSWLTDYIIMWFIKDSKFWIVQIIMWSTKNNLIMLNRHGKLAEIFAMLHHLQNPFSFWHNQVLVTILYSTTTERGWGKVGLYNIIIKSTQYNSHDLVISCNLEQLWFWGLKNNNNVQLNFLPFKATWNNLVF